MTQKHLAGKLIHHGYPQPRNARIDCNHSCASHTTIQYFVLRRMRRRRLRLRFLHLLQLLYLFHRARRMLVGRQPRRAWVFPRPQNWFQQLLNNRALDFWWKENFRVSRATFEFICQRVGPVIQRQSTRMRDAIPVNKRVAASLWRLATGDCYRSCGLMIGGNRKEHSKAKTKNTHREPRKFAMLVTETSKRDAASAPISPKKKMRPACAPDYAVSCY